MTDREDARLRDAESRLRRCLSEAEYSWLTAGRGPRATSEPVWDPKRGWDAALPDQVIRELFPAREQLRLTTGHATAFTHEEWNHELTVGYFANSVYKARRRTEDVAWVVGNLLLPVWLLAVLWQTWGTLMAACAVTALWLGLLAAHFVWAAVDAEAYGQEWAYFVKHYRYATKNMRMTYVHCNSERHARRRERFHDDFDAALAVREDEPWAFKDW